MNPAAASPVIVVSPALRAGSTLVQRLLCSAPNTLIYGDMIGQEMEFFAKYAYVRRQALSFHQGQNAAMRAAVLAGNTADFISPLSLPLAEHVEGLRAASLAWLHSCAQDARAAGRGVWGWKLAGADAMALTILGGWLPEARWVWLERDLKDSFRSAKAANMAAGPAQAAAFARSAAAATAAFAPLADKALMLEYKAMLADPAGTVRRLEQHTGAAGVDVSVFSQRLNAPGTGVWVPPADLTAEEEAAFAGPAPVVLSQPVSRAA